MFNECFHCLVRCNFSFCRISLRSHILPTLVSTLFLSSSFFFFLSSHLIRYDYVQPRQNPEQWNLSALFLVSSVMAAVACLSSLLLLWFLLDSWEPLSVFQAFGIGGVSYGQVTTAIYLKVSVSDFLTLFSARTGPDFFWTTAPSPVLLVAGFVALGKQSV